MTDWVGDPNIGWRRTAEDLKADNARLTAELHASIRRQNARLEEAERSLYLQIHEQETRAEQAEQERDALKAVHEEWRTQWQDAVRLRDGACAERDKAEADNARLEGLVHAGLESERHLLTENARLRGITPELPPRPPEGHGLPRYGVRHNGPTEPLAVPMEDGYWTPWHLAAGALALLRLDVEVLREERDAAISLSNQAVTDRDAYHEQCRLERAAANAAEQACGVATARAEQAEQESATWRASMRYQRGVPRDTEPPHPNSIVALQEERQRLEERLREVTAEWESCVERDRAHRQEMQAHGRDYQLARDYGDEQKARAEQAEDLRRLAVATAIQLRSDKEEAMQLMDGAFEDLKKADAEVARLTEENRTYRGSPVAYLHRRIAQLAAALQRYGQHDAGCVEADPVNEADGCTCGLTALLRPANWQACAVCLNLPGQSCACVPPQS